MQDHVYLRGCTGVLSDIAGLSFSDKCLYPGCGFHGSFFEPVLNISLANLTCKGFFFMCLLRQRDGSQNWRHCPVKNPSFSLIN